MINFQVNQLWSLWEGFLFSNEDKVLCSKTHAIPSGKARTIDIFISSRTLYHGAPIKTKCVS